MKNPKIGIIVQARTGSKRLPNKMLAIIEGKTVFEHVIDRLKRSKYGDNIILATTDKENDKALVKISEKIGISHFRGSEDDVLSRYLGTIEKFNLDVVVRVCSDNPFMDPDGIDQIVDYLLKNDLDYVANVHEKGWPEGFAGEAVKKDSLLKVDKLTSDIKYREHVTFYIRKNPELFKVAYIDAPLDIQRPRLRLSIDTIEDLNVVNNIYKRLYKPGSIIHTREIIKLIDKEPEILTHITDKTKFQYDLEHYIKK